MDNSESRKVITPFECSDDMCDDEACSLYWLIVNSFTHRPRNNGLSPMDGLPDRQIILINNQQLAYYPNNESYILSHCSDDAIDSKCVAMLQSGYELSQEIEGNRFDYMKI